MVMGPGDIKGFACERGKKREEEELMWICTGKICISVIN